MKKIIFNKHSLLVIFSAALMHTSCTKLEPQIEGARSEAQIVGGAPATPSTSTVYNQLNQLSNAGNSFAMSEHSTDELMGPTRGTDWDDFGAWRKLHLHTWDPTHVNIINTWNGLNGALYQTTLLTESTTASAADKVAGRFLRAYFSYWVVDLYGQLQHRPATALIADLPKVYTRTQAIDFIITELEATIPALPSYTRATQSFATREAAQFLLAKCYLNKSVFKQDPAKADGPYTFDAADMNKVISLCNDIAANPQLSVANFYWDNFVWNNGALSTENIFVRRQEDGQNVNWCNLSLMHYSMPPDGWNGFATLADFYNTFEAQDERRNADITASRYTELTGRQAGFLIGQQYGPKDKKIGNPIVPLRTRNGNLLILTPYVNLFYAEEVQGIRISKYPLDPAEMPTGGDRSKNAFVLMRFSDVRLMKAEALLRGGADASETPLAIVNEIRVKRKATPLASVDLTKLLAERGRELFLEAVRRNDMIRFGIFNKPVDQRPQVSPGYRCVYPIPAIAVASNPNLKQNFGY